MLYWISEVAFDKTWLFVRRDRARDPACSGGVAVNQGAGREPFTGTGDLRELLCEEVSLAWTTAWPRLSPCWQDNGSRRT
jgi:hypothetical protein